MPDPSLLTPLGLRMIADLPPVLRNSTDYQAVIHAYAKEIELVEAAIETVRAQFNPATADALLPAWEYEVKLPPGGLPGATIDQRRAAVLARLRNRFSGQGRDWEAAITAMFGPSWSYQEHDPADSGSPAAGVIRVFIPWPSGTPAFEAAQLQIRAITDAHLEIDFVSTAGFHLDVSEMDITEFGA